jgi:hypothetical protein
MRTYILYILLFLTIGVKAQEPFLHNDTVTFVALITDYNQTTQGSQYFTGQVDSSYIVNNARRHLFVNKYEHITEEAHVCRWVGMDAHKNIYWWDAPQDSAAGSKPYPLFRAKKKKGNIYYKASTPHKIKLLQCSIHPHDTIKVDDISQFAAPEPQLGSTRYYASYTKDTSMQLHGRNIECYVVKMTKPRGFDEFYTEKIAYIDKKTLIPIIEIEYRYTTTHLPNTDLHSPPAQKLVRRVMIFPKQ